MAEDKDEMRVRAAKARADALSPQRRAEIASDAAKARWSSDAPEVRTNDHIVVYHSPNGIQVELKYAGETMWATQRQMADMFGVKVSSISRHLKRIFAEGELIEDSVVALNAITADDGKVYPTKVYDLNVVISVGYRIESRHGTMFRIWATDKLIQYLTKGFVMDDERLKNPDGRADFFDELLDRIRDIRSSERRMWTRVLELAKFCTDFDATDRSAHEQFFATIQNAMHWAVTQETAAEVIYHRVDAAKPNAGVMNFKGDEPTSAEAKVAKNYYAESEIGALNILTSAVLEFFQSQAEQRRQTTLRQFLDKMREFIKLDGRPLIPNGHLGRISMDHAKERAAQEIAAYKEVKRLEKENAGESHIGELLQKARALAKAKKAK